jgi:GT2 family glycosyltransferase
MDLSVCIVNWNTKEFLDTCIHSIITNTHGIDYEVIVVDNNSSDDSLEMLKAKYSWCRTIINKNNVGFAKANNQALDVAQGRYVIFLNPDTELITNAFYTMVKFLDTNKQYGAVGCKLLNADGTIQFTCARTFPTPFNQFCHFAMLTRLFPKSSFFSNEDMEYWDHNDSRDIDVISGACCMGRHDILKQLGGFDENIFMYSEDVDLCHRIKKMNWKIYYLAEEKIIHYAGAASSQRSDLYFVPILLRKGHLYFIKKHYGSLQAFCYRTVVFFGTSMRLIVLIMIFLIACIANRNNKQKIWVSLKQHARMLLWAVGLTELETALRSK